MAQLRANSRLLHPDFLSNTDLYEFARVDREQFQVLGSIEVERGQGKGHHDPDHLVPPDPKHPDPGRGLPVGCSKLVHFDKEIGFCTYMKYS